MPSFPTLRGFGFQTSFPLAATHTDPRLSISPSGRVCFSSHTTLVSEILFYHLHPPTRSNFTHRTDYAGHGRHNIRPSGVGLFSLKHLPEKQETNYNGAPDKCIEIELRFKHHLAVGFCCKIDWLPCRHKHTSTYTRDAVLLAVIGNSTLFNTGSLLLSCTVRVGLKPPSDGVEGRTKKP